jgi:predicted nucleic acid-binding protein
MITAPPAGVSAPKAMGDCYLLALSQATGSTLVTFDAGLAALARKAHLDVVLLD